MPNHIIGHDYDFSHLMAAYHADPQNEVDAHYLLYKGNDILALCLRHKFNPEPDEVWVGNDPVVAQWGQNLAGLKNVKALPLYYSGANRTLYTFKGYYVVTDDTQEPAELAKRKGPVPLSRIVFISPLPQPSQGPPK